MELTAREWAVLEVLVRRPNAIVSREQIEDALYAFDRRSRATRSRFISAGSGASSGATLCAPRAASATGSGVETIMGHSLVSRLIWLLASAMAVLWLLGSVTAGMLTVFEVNERLDNALVEVAQRLLPATEDALSAPQAMDDRARQLVSTLNPKALAYQIMAPDGWVALRSINAPAAPFVPPALNAGFRNVPHWRVYTQPAAAGGYLIEVAEPKMHRHEALRRAIGLAVLPLLLFLPALLADDPLGGETQHALADPSAAGDRPARRFQPDRYPGTADALGAGADPYRGEPFAGPAAAGLGE